MLLICAALIGMAVVRKGTHEQDCDRAFMTGGPTSGMPDTLRLRRDPLSVSAANPTLVTFVQRRRDTSCTGITGSEASTGCTQPYPVASFHWLNQLACWRLYLHPQLP